MSHLYYSLSSCFFILTLKILCMGPKCDSGTWEGRAGKFEASLVYIMRLCQKKNKGMCFLRLTTSVILTMVLCHLESMLLGGGVCMGGKSHFPLIHIQYFQSRKREVRRLL